MPGLAPSVHVFEAAEAKDVDGRGRPGHDDGKSFTLLFLRSLSPRQSAS